MAIDALQFVGGLLLGVAIGSVGSRLSRKARANAAAVPPALSISDAAARLLAGAPPMLTR
jgi:NhaP-type Na+/H+ or K+/H+ antiporter